MEQGTPPEVAAQFAKPKEPPPPPKEPAKQPESQPVQPANFTPLEVKHEEKKVDAKPADPETQRALDNLDLRNPKAPQEIADLLIKAREQNLPNLDSVVAKVRLRREAGNVSYRVNDPPVYVLDEVVIRLLQADYPELAKGLISSSPADMDHINRSIQRNVDEPKDQELLKKRAEALQLQKQEELIEQLTANGCDEQTQQWLITKAHDPDSASMLDSRFWDQMKTFPGGTQEVLIERADIASAATMLSALQERSLITLAPKILAKWDRLPDHDARMNYINSVHDVMDIITADWSRIQGIYQSPDRAIEAVLGFVDPVGALKGCKELYGDQYGTKLGEFQGLFNTYTGGLTEIRPETVSGLKVMREYFEGPGKEVAEFYDVAGTIIRREDAGEFSSKLVSGLKIAQNISGLKLVVYDLAQSSRPEELARSYVALEPLMVGKDVLLIGDLRGSLNDAPKPEELAQTYLDTERRLAQNGLSLDIVGSSRFQTFAVSFEYNKTNPDRDKLFETACSDWKIESEIKKFYDGYIGLVLRSGGLKTSSTFRPELRNMPELTRQFDQMGIGQEEGNEILRTWSSYSEIKKTEYNARDGKVFPSEEPFIVTAQTAEILKQYKSLSEYGATYGAEEARLVIETFGIHNFRRYKPELLHNQMESWRKGEVPAQNILISARADWNGAMQTVGETYGNILGTEGTFFFEAQDTREMAIAAVKTGNRERSHGRKPDLKNVVIDAHATSNFLRLGQPHQHHDGKGEDDGTLSIANFINAQKGRKAMGGGVNDYQRHLGKNYRIILQACSTAGEVIGGANIAQTISADHNTRVEASPVNTSGSITIEADGSVIFRVSDDEKIGATAPAVTYISGEEQIAKPVEDAA